MKSSENRPVLAADREPRLESDEREARRGRASRSPRWRANDNSNPESRIPHLPTYLPIYLPTYLPTYLPIYLPTYLPTDAKVLTSRERSGRARAATPRAPEVGRR